MTFVDGVMWDLGEDDGDYWTLDCLVYKCEWRKVAARIEELVDLMGVVEISRKKLDREAAGWVAACLKTHYRYDPVGGFWVFQRESPAQGNC